MILYSPSSVRFSWPERSSTSTVLNQKGLRDLRQRCLGVLLVAGSFAGSIRVEHTSAHNISLRLLPSRSLSALPH